jgi:transposase InsO family protein
MKENKMSFNISTMCKILKVSQSCYYQWIKQGSIVHKVDEQLNELIKEIFEQSRQTYGTRRIREALMKKDGLVMSLNKIGKIMKHLNLQVKMRRRFRVVTTDSNHNYPIAPNRLDRDFYSSAANNTYVGDITYIPTREGWLYLATVIDLYSRKVVGWSMDETMKVSLVNDALEMAIKRRKCLAYR